MKRETIKTVWKKIQEEYPVEDESVREKAKKFYDRNRNLLRRTIINRKNALLIRMRISNAQEGRCEHEKHNGDRLVSSGYIVDFYYWKEPFKDALLEQGEGKLRSRNKSFFCFSCTTKISKKKEPFEEDLILLSGFQEGCLYCCSDLVFGKDFSMREQKDTPIELILFFAQTVQESFLGEHSDLLLWE